LKLENMRYPLKNWKRLKRGYSFGAKTFYSDFHLGTDYLVPDGTPVFAPLKCEIVKVGNFPEGGNTIHVKMMEKEYGLLVMRLMHLSKVFPLGKYKAGEILGRTGNTGSLTRGPHLHIDLSRGKVKTGVCKNFIDPDKFFSLRPSRRRN